MGSGRANALGGGGHSPAGESESRALLLPPPQSSTMQNLTIVPNGGNSGGGPNNGHVRKVLLFLFFYFLDNWKLIYTIHLQEGERGDPREWHGRLVRLIAQGIKTRGVRHFVKLLSFMNLSSSSIVIRKTSSPSEVKKVHQLATQRMLLLTYSGECSLYATHKECNTHPIHQVKVTKR